MEPRDRATPAGTSYGSSVCERRIRLHLLAEVDVAWQPGPQSRIWGP